MIPDLLNPFLDHEYKEPEKEHLQCPVCKSEKIEDISSYQSNGIYGPGSASWKTFDARCCNECGVIFRPIKK